MKEGYRVLANIYQPTNQDWSFPSSPGQIFGKVRLWVETLGFRPKDCRGIVETKFGNHVGIWMNEWPEFPLRLSEKMNWYLPQ